MTEYIQRTTQIKNIYKKAYWEKKNPFFIFFLFFSFSNVVYHWLVEYTFLPMLI